MVNGKRDVKSCVSFVLVLGHAVLYCTGLAVSMASWGLPHQARTRCLGRCLGWCPRETAVRPGDTGERTVALTWIKASTRRLK